MPPDVRPHGTEAESLDETATLTLARCPVCGEQRLVPLPLPGRWIGEEVFAPRNLRLGLSECQACRFVFTNPRPSTTLLEAFYSGPSYACHHASSSSSTERKAEFLLSRFEKYRSSSGQRLLDYGCGGGWLLRYAIEHGWSATGYDIGGRAIASCHEQGLEVTGDLGSLAPGSFDIIMLNHVFEHLEHPADVLSELGPLLAPEGRLLIEVPNARSLRARLSEPLASRYLRFDERYRAFPIHLSYFSPSTLTRLVERNDLEVVGVETYGLGVDELFATDDDSAEPYPDPSPRIERLRQSGTTGWKASAMRLFKQVVKRTLFGSGLGENLLVVAQPTRH
jgi:SAM-dependent methyltransferase